MFDRHTGDIMSTMVNKFLTVLCPDCTICLLGLTSDRARNMTGRVAVLDLVMEDIMNNVIKERFFSVMTGFITHLTR